MAASDNMHVEGRASRDKAAALKRAIDRGAAALGEVSVALLDGNRVLAELAVGHGGIDLLLQDLVVVDLQRFEISSTLQGWMVE